MSVNGAEMAETTTNRKGTEMADSKATYNSPFIGPDGKPVKVTKEERDNLKLLGVDFDAAKATSTGESASSSSSTTEKKKEGE